MTRDGAVLLGEDDLAAITTRDGLVATTESDDLFPYQLYTVEVPEGAGDDFTARVHWSGSANAEARIGLHVLDVTAASGTRSTSTSRPMARRQSSSSTHLSRRRTT